MRQGKTGVFIERIKREAFCRHPGREDLSSRWMLISGALATSNWRLMLRGVRVSLLSLAFFELWLDVRGLNAGE